MQKGVKDQQTAPLITSQRIPVKPLMRRVESLAWHYFPIKHAKDGSTAFRVFIPVQTMQLLAAYFGGQSHFFTWLHNVSQSKAECSNAHFLHSNTFLTRSSTMQLEKAIQKAKESIPKPISPLISDQPLCSSSVT